MVIYLIPNLSKKNVAVAAKEVANTLLSFGATVLICDETKNYFEGICVIPCTRQQALQQCDIIVTLGGDGTLLKAARQTVAAGKPILGVNYGRVGFLAVIEAHEKEKLHQLVLGNWTIRHQYFLQAKQSDGTISYGLNDIVVGKQNIGQTIELSILCNQIELLRYIGDGVVIATPTGSTAYSLSAGGPILDCEINSMLIAPICAHSLQSPPFVLSDKRALEIQVKSYSSTSAVLCCDGLEEKILTTEEKITVSFSKQKISFVQFNETEQFYSIHKKLKGR